MSETGEFVSSDGVNYEAANDADAYNEAWEAEDAAEYFVVPETGGGGGGGHENRGGPPAQSQLTVISRSNGRVTVRNNVPMEVSGSVPFNGSGSATVAPNSTFSGADRNGNSIPDLLELCLRRGICRLPRTG